MKVTLLAHACLWLEHAGTSVLIDPWLQGTAYDGAWALAPAPPRGLDDLPRPDWVLYSHGHPDHFHLPTLEALAARFGRDLRLLFPRHALPHLRDEALRLGFRRVQELPLERAFSLGRDFSVRCFPMRADDSLQVFHAGARTLLNANDCQLGTNLRKRLAHLVPAPDFYCGQFASADAYPFALDGLSDAERSAAAALPAHQLRQTAEALDARFVVPTAGFARFAHADNAWMNRWLTRVDEIGTDGKARLEVLYPGDGWSEAEGFERQPSHREAYLRALAAERDGTLPLTPRQPAPPNERIVRAAAERFTPMFGLLPLRLRRRIGKLGFHLEDAAAALTVDWVAQTLTWDSSVPDAPYYSLAASHFVHTCASRWGWSDFHVSARFRVHGWRDNHAVETFLPASILCELGYLPAPSRALLRPRALRALWARRGEAVDLVGSLLQGRLRRGAPFSRL